MKFKRETILTLVAICSGYFSGLPKDHNANLTAAYQSAAKFKEDDQDAIDKTGSRLASLAAVKELEGKVKDFATSSQVMMKVLDEIRGIHPVIGAFNPTYQVQFSRDIYTTFLNRCCRNCFQSCCNAG